MWFTIALFVASLVLSVILAPKPTQQNAIAGQFDQVNLPQATAAAPCPMVFGSVRMRGPNTIWAGNYKANPIVHHESEYFFFSKKVIIGYAYYLDLDLAVCLGENVIWRRIWFNQDLVWTGPTQSPDDGSAYWIVVNDPDWLGGPSGGGGYTGKIYMYSGNFNQQQDPWNVLFNGANAPTYAGVAHAVFRDFYWGQQNQLPTISFDLTRLPNTLGLPGDTYFIPDPNYPNQSGTPPTIPPAGATAPNGSTNPDGSPGSTNGINTVTDQYIVYSAPGEYDSNPMEVIYQILTQPWGGLGLNPDLINTDTFLAAGATLYSEGNGCSVIIDTNNTAKDILSQLCRQIQGLLYQDQTTGLISVKLIRNDYVVSDLPVLDESNIIELKDYNAQTWKQTFNQVRVQFNGRINRYTDDYALAQDFANFQFQGRLISSQLSMPTVFAAQNAINIAARELSLQSVPLYKCQITANRQAGVLQPGSCFVLNWSDYGIVSQVFRVQKIQLGSLTDGKITLQCLQDTFATGLAQWGVPITRGQTFGFYAPSNIVTVYIEELSHQLTVIVGLTPVSGQAFLQVYALNPGGYNVGYSVTDSYSVTNGGSTVTNTYDEIDNVPFPSYGQLAAPYTTITDNYYDPEGTITLTSIPTITNFIQSPTTAQHRAGANMFVLDGEYFQFDSYAVSGSQLILTGIRRGMSDTNPTNNSTGDILYFLDPTYAYSSSLLADVSGITNDVYVLATTGEQSQETTDVTPFSAPLLQRADRPLQPRYIEIGGSRALYSYTWGATMTVSWRQSNYLVNSLYFEDDPTDTPPANQTYLIELVPPNENPETGASTQSYSVAAGNTSASVTFTEDTVSNTTGYFYLRISSFLPFGTGSLQCWSPKIVLVLVAGDSALDLVADRVTGDFVQDRDYNFVLWR